MRRILMMVLRNWYYVPFAWIKLCWRAAYPDKYTDYEHFVFLRDITRRANKGGNVNIIVTGRENIPKQDGFMYFPNHQGLYDVLAMLETSPAPFSVVAKKEVKDIPFLKQVLSCMRAFLLDRENVRQAMEVINNVSKEVEKGRNYLIFAEGTRSKKGNETLEFKSGSFKSAMKAKCPVVPVVLVDSFKPFDISSLAPVDVQVHILKPLYYEDYKEMKTRELAACVKARIDEKMKEIITEKGIDNKRKL